MFLLRPPSDAAIARHLRAQAALGFSYPEVGATAAALPARYAVDRARVRLGDGDAALARAKFGLQRWRQFALGWLSVCPADAPLAVGQTVAIVARTLRLWSLSAARIVYLVDEPRRFGFAYGTLPGHVERGEERFLVEQTDDGAVWYDLLAFSQPRHPLARLGYPYVRRTQARFRRDSTAAMLRWMHEAN